MAFSYFKNGITDLIPSNIIDFDTIVDLILNNPEDSIINQIRILRIEGNEIYKKIKQINPITNTYIFFNNLNEIQLKLGISSKTIINSINNKTVHAGSLWEFA